MAAPFPEDQTLIEKIEIECPHCGSRQRESASGLSTYCRSCGQHIKLQGRPPPPVKRSLWSLGKTEPVPPLATATRKPRADTVAVPLLLAGSSAKEGAVFAQSGEHPESPSTAHAPVARREVVCFDCRAINKASAKATSTQCANCGTFIDLRDVEIRDRSTQRIRTRGNVTVHKKGALLGTAVHCGSLIIEGSVAGSIYAQETVEFRTDAKVLGEIRCRRLLVEKRCQVQGLQPIHVETLELQGHLSARVLSSGTVYLRKNSRLEGSVNAAQVKMEPGAEWEGVMRVGGSPSGLAPFPSAG